MIGYKQPLSYAIVEKAVCADTIAVICVLKHYESYINKLAKFDVEAKCRLESKLLLAIQKFIL